MNDATRRRGERCPDEEWDAPRITKKSFLVMSSDGRFLARVETSPCYRLELIEGVALDGSRNRVKSTH